MRDWISAALAAAAAGIVLPAVAAPVTPQMPPRSEFARQMATMRAAGLRYIQLVSGNRERFRAELPGAPVLVKFGDGNDAMSTTELAPHR